MIHDINWNNKRNNRSNYRSYIRKFLLFPDLWRSEELNIEVDLEWNQIKFASNNWNELPTNNGLYCFVIIPFREKSKLFETHYLLYIGKASGTTIRQRYKDYLNEKRGIGKGSSKPRFKVQEMLNDFEDDIYFFYTCLDRSDLIIQVEEKLINMFIPFVNTQIPEAVIKPELKYIYE